MIRTFDFEAKRYGEPSTMADSFYDHPFQWGSKRPGPDLAREGGRYPNLWHYRHLLDPREVSPGSNMPPFAFLAGRTVDLERTSDKLRALRSVGVPYDAKRIEGASADAAMQGRQIAKNLQEEGVAGIDPRSEIVALVAYLQRLGKQHENGPPAGAGRRFSAAEETMHSQLLAQSPLLLLPIVAMFLFLLVWVVVSVRVMTQSRLEIEAAARLPLEDDHERQ